MKITIESVDKLFIKFSVNGKKHLLDRNKKDCLCFDGLFFSAVKFRAVDDKKTGRTTCHFKEFKIVVAGNRIDEVSKKRTYLGGKMNLIKTDKDGVIVVKCEGFKHEK